MTDAVQNYLFLLFLGVLLLGAEVFLPGGVLGIIGALCLIGAAIAGFSAFGPQWGVISMIAIVIAAGIGMALWIRFFPRTAVGKRLSLSKSGADFKSYPDETRLLTGKKGVALSALRPSGIARIEDRRVDVVADGDWIEEGTPIVVASVEGVRILVQPAEPGAQAEGGHS
jgi:membrane-bound serine protease (ClpP class)